MSDNGRISLLFALSLLLYLIAGEANNLLARWAVHIHVDALLVIFFGLYLNRISGLLYTVLLGFLADAMHPTPAGTYMVGYLCMWLFFVWSQRRMRRQNPVHVRTVAGIAQTLWLLALTMVMGTGQSDLTAFWGRMLVDLACSTALVAVVAPYWCVFQKEFLLSLGWNIDAQTSPV